LDRSARPVGRNDKRSEELGRLWEELGTLWEEVIRSVKNSNVLWEEIERIGKKWEGCVK